MAFELTFFLMDIVASLVVVISAIFIFLILKLVWPSYQKAMGVKITFVHVRRLTKQEVIKDINEEIMQQKRRKEIVEQHDKAMEKIKAESK